MSRVVRREGYYPNKGDNEIVTKTKILINNKSILLMKYESSKRVNLYIGGHEKWCIHCELIKDGNTVKPLGFLIKLRYDMLCSLDNHFERGADTKQLTNVLIKYIYKNYPTVKELSFNDLSVRTCDDDSSVNLAVMTYLYEDKTWYEKNYDAYISPQSKKEFELAVERYNKAKEIPWEEMKEIIINREYLSKYISEEDWMQLYIDAPTWKDFFKQIVDAIKIDKFCIFVSGWLDMFMLKYFNNLKSYVFIIPIKDRSIIFKEEEYHRGGKKYTKKNNKKYSQDEK
jgi:hypothetical protein